MLLDDLFWLCIVKTCVLYDSREKERVTLARVLKIKERHEETDSIVKKAFRNKKSRKSKSGFEKEKTRQKRFALFRRNRAFSAYQFVCALSSPTRAKRSKTEDQTKES